jgi:glycosyltransferase involved in cell wall biosynthesis
MFSNFYPPVVSGSSIQVASLCRELVKRGVCVVVITAKVVDGSAEYEFIDGVHIYRLPAFRLPKIALGFNFPWISFTFTPGNVRRIKRIIEKHDPQMLHLHNYMFDLAFSAVLMRMQTKIPLVITIHTYLKHPSYVLNIIFFLIERIMLTFPVIRQADCIICPDWNVQQYTGLAFGNVPTALVPYGIVVQHPEKEMVTKIKKRYGLVGKRIILSLGHLHDMRNRKDLIEAMPQVLKEFPNAVLFIAGAVYTDFPIALVSKLGLQNSVIFAGSVPHIDIPALLKIADLESHWLNQNEPAKTSLGIASLEAMYLGKVVLAAANPDTYGNGLLQNGENIVFVKPGNTIQLAQTIVALLRDDVRRSTIGQRASQTIHEHFSWDSVCEQTLRVYQQAIQKKASK